MSCWGWGGGKGGGLYLRMNDVWGAGGAWAGAGERERGRGRVVGSWGRVIVGGKLLLERTTRYRMGALKYERWDCAGTSRPVAGISGKAQIHS
jgi:hypothetical protein